MATAPKAVPKAAPKVVPLEEAPEAAPPPKKSKKKRIVLLSATALLVLGAGGGAAWYFMQDSQDHPGEAKVEPPKPPVFVVMEPFTVNLQPDGAGDQYLQLAFSLQVADQEQVDRLKLYMPLARSRILLLLSSKKASDISTIEGKKKLSEEIIAQVKQPFAPNVPPVAVSGVFFTSFVIQ